MNQTYKVQVSMNQASIVQTDLVFKQGDFGFQIAIEILDFASFLNIFCHHLMLLLLLLMK